MTRNLNFNSKIKLELQRNIANLKQVVIETVKISNFVDNVVNLNQINTQKNVLTAPANNKQKSSKLLEKSISRKLLDGLHPGVLLSLYLLGD